jgi:hypothetical protein
MYKLIVIFTNRAKLVHHQAAFPASPSAFGCFAEPGIDA